jgi:hypothetical protein
VGVWRPRCGHLVSAGHEGRAGSCVCCVTSYQSVLEGVQGGKVTGLRARVKGCVLGSPEPPGSGGQHSMCCTVVAYLCSTPMRRCSYCTCLWESRDHMCIEIRAHLQKTSSTQLD